MSDQSKNPSSDDLIKAKKPDDIQLNEEDLSKVVGGTDLKMKIDPIETKVEPIVSYDISQNKAS